MHLAVSHMAEQYQSPVIGLKLGNERTIVVLTHDVVQHVHTQEEYEGRPYNFFIKLRSMGARRGKLKHKDVKTVEWRLSILTWKDYICMLSTQRSPGASRDSLTAIRLFHC